MAVVFHHIGRPRHSTISQSDKITNERRRVSEGFSGGGCLRPTEVVVAPVVVLATASFSERLVTAAESGVLVVAWSEAAGTALVISESMSTSWTGVAADMATLATWRREERSSRLGERWPTRLNPGSLQLAMRAIRVRVLSGFCHPTGPSLLGCVANGDKIRMEQMEPSLGFTCEQKALPPGRSTIGMRQSNAATVLYLVCQGPTPQGRVHTGLGLRAAWKMHSSAGTERDQSTWRSVGRGPLSGRIHAVSSPLGGVRPLIHIPLRA